MQCKQFPVSFFVFLLSNHARSSQSGSVTSAFLYVLLLVLIVYVVDYILLGLLFKMP